jgi:hypothetical protein
MADQKGNPDTSGPTKESADFFDTLDRQVNSAIFDDADSVIEPQEEVTQEAVETQEETPVDDGWESDDNPYKKRYSDSTRENQKNQAETRKAQELEPYRELINVMKEDPGAVEVMKNYLTSDGQPKETIKEAYGLPEDFVFDLDEAITDQGSKSAELAQHLIGGYVNQAVEERMQAEKALTGVRSQKAQVARQEAEFKAKSGMDDAEFDAMMKKANARNLTFEDIHYLTSREGAADKIQKQTRDDLMKQVKNVSRFPQSAASTGGVKHDEITHTQGVFNAIKNADVDIDSLFE